MAGFHRQRDPAEQHRRGQRNQVFLDDAARNVFDELRQRDTVMREELENATSKFRFEMERIQQKLETCESEVAAPGMIEEAKEDMRAIETETGTLEEVSDQHPIYKDVEAMLREQGMPNVEIRSVQRVDMMDEYLKAYEEQATGRDERLLWFCSSVIDPRKVIRSKHGIDYRPFSGKFGRGLYGAEYAVYADSCFAYETENRTRLLMLFRAVTGKPFDYRNVPQKSHKDDNNQEPWPFNKTTTYLAAPNGYDCVWAPLDDLCRSCKETPLGGVMKPPLSCRCFWTPAEYRPFSYNQLNGNKSVAIRRVSSPVFCIYPSRARGRVASGDGQAQTARDPKDLEPAILALPLALVEYVNPDSQREPRWRRWVLANSDPANSRSKSARPTVADAVESMARMRQSHSLEDLTDMESKRGDISVMRVQTRAEEDYMAALDAEFQAKAKDHRNAEKRWRHWESFSEQIRVGENSLTMELRAAKEVTDEVFNLRHDLKSSEKQAKKLEKNKHELERQDKNTRNELERALLEFQAEVKRNTENSAELTQLRKDLGAVQKTLAESRQTMESKIQEEQETLNSIKIKMEKTEKDNSDLRTKCLVANSGFSKKEQWAAVALSENAKKMEELKSELAKSKVQVQEMLGLKEVHKTVKEEAKEAHRLRGHLRKAQKENEILLTKRRTHGSMQDVKSEFKSAEKEVERLKKPHCELEAMEEEEPLYEEVEAMLRRQGLPNVEIKAVYRTEMDEQYEEKYRQNAEDQKQVNLWLGSGGIDPREILCSEHCLDYRQYLTFGRLGKGLYGWEYAVYPDSCLAFENEDHLRSLLLYKAIVGNVFDVRNATSKSGKDDHKFFEHPLNKSATYWAPPYGHDSVYMPEDCICEACRQTQLGAELTAECTCPIIPHEFQPEKFNSQQGWAKNKIPFRRRISSPMYCLSLPADADKHHPSDGQSQHWGEKQQHKIVAEWGPYVVAMPIAIVEYRNPDVAKEPHWRTWAADPENDQAGAGSVGHEMLVSELETERHLLHTLEEDHDLQMKLLKNAENRLRNWEKLANDADLNYEKHQETAEESERIRLELEEHAEAAQATSEKMKEDEKKAKKEKKKLQEKVVALEEELEQAREAHGQLGSENQSMYEFKKTEQKEYVRQRDEHDEMLQNVQQEFLAEEAAFTEYRAEYEKYKDIAAGVDPNLLVSPAVAEALKRAKKEQNYDEMVAAIASADKSLQKISEKLDIAGFHKALDTLELKGPARHLLNQLHGKQEERVLDLRKKNIDDTIFGIFLKRLPQFKKLQKLMLNENMISPDGAAKLVPVLPRMPTLVELNLSGNKVGEQNKKALVSAWKNMGKDVRKLVITE